MTIPDVITFYLRILLQREIFSMKRMVGQHARPPRHDFSVFN
jgi:hypothetical protein